MLDTLKLSMARPRAIWVGCSLLTIMLIVAFVPISPAAKPAIVINMMDMPASFQPERMTIKTGDTVEWKNVGSQLHHVTTDPSAALKKSDVSSPPGAKPFDSGFLKPGDSFTQRFSVPGVYRYTCAVHEAKGMNGEIVVQQ
jgi:plastocyanin